jgi:type II secretory pathway component PulJ
MEIYWLAVYNGRYEYSALQKLEYSEWRKRAKEMLQRLQRKAVTA